MMPLYSNMLSRLFGVYRVLTAHDQHAHHFRTLASALSRICRSSVWVRLDTEFGDHTPVGYQLKSSLVSIQLMS